jgi:hypothetical protein
MACDCHLEHHVAVFNRLKDKRKGFEPIHGKKKSIRPSSGSAREDY